MKAIWIVLAACSILFISACEKSTYVLIQTDFGDMKAILYNDTPEHRDNFVKLIEESFYEGLLFHRVVSGFIVQGGDPKSRRADPGVALGNGGPGYIIPSEIKHLHYHGALAAARQTGPQNPEKNSSGSQFYFVQGRPVTAAELGVFQTRNNTSYTEEQKQHYLKVGGTPGLDGDYTVFGMLVEGHEVLNKLAAVPVRNRNRPLENIKMKVSIVK